VAKFESSLGLGLGTVVCRYYFIRKLSYFYSIFYIKDQVGISTWETAGLGAQADP
jgi:hypothetical protein